ncbi:MAG: ribosomal protein S18-alanine N-acetyltransferase [Acidobacteria bacterium]|nr:ribosomal protein S18-alanine N-acetyltransferase [Acidobacteriota bacterium]
MGVGVITIREFEPGDVEAALAMEEVAQPQPWTERIFNDELSAENRTYLVADDGAVCGYGGVMLMGDEAHITNLLVAPDHRGQGIGRRLMIGLIESAIAEGARHLILEVRSENEAARSLYSRLGLAPVGVRPGYYDDGDALIMWAHDIDSAEYAERLR